MLILMRFWYVFKTSKKTQQNLRKLKLLFWLLTRIKTTILTTIIITLKPYQNITAKPGHKQISAYHNNKTYEFPSKSFTSELLLLWLSLLGMGLSLSRVLWNQHIRDPTWSQNPFLNRLGNGSRSCFVGFRCFGNTSCSFNFAFICMHFPSFSFHLHAYCSHIAFIIFHVPFMFLSCSFHVPFMFLSCSFHVPFIYIHFPSFSFRIPFMFIPVCIHILSFSFHLHACSFHFALMSFHVLSKVMEMVLWFGQWTECNKSLSLSYR